MITLADTWLHDLSPILFEVPGVNLPIRWYGLSYLAGFIIAAVLLTQLAKRNLIAIPASRVLDAMWMLVAGVMVGGRLGYVLIYQPSLFISFSQSFPFWGVLRLTDGGMASHGGMIGVIIAAWWISRGFRPDEAPAKSANTSPREGACPVLHVTDALALVAPFGLMLGRLANFINGELLGRIIAQPGEPVPAWASWFAVKFPQERLEPSRAPELTFEQSRELAGLIDTYVPAGALAEPVSDLERYQILLQKLQAGIPGVAEGLAPLISARAPSQLLQAFAEGVVVAAAVWFVARLPRRPGVVGCWFLIVYGIGRILTEFIRLPDAHFAAETISSLTSPRPLGLARGQWLSLLMVLTGVGFLVWRTRTPAETYLGWLKPSPNATSTPAAEPADAKRRPKPDRNQPE